MDQTRSRSRLLPALLSGALALCAVASLRAQTAPVPAAQEAAARAELASLGVDEGELRRRLLERGIDVDALTAEQLVAARPTIEAVVAEMVAEQESAGTPPAVTPAGSADEQEPATTPEEVAAELDATARTAEETLAQTSSAAVGIYGHDIFRNRTLEVYRAADQIRAPDTYILDAGDEVAVSIFGVSQADLVLEIGEDGFVRPPEMPRIYLRGRTLGEARRLVRSRMSNYYVFAEGQFSLTLDVARTISVNIFGEVEAPGTYTLSALNSALNALVAAGGPTELGSVRAIELVSDGRRRLIDVYAFLDDPSAASGFSLKDNDVIYVPPRRKLVTARGGLLRPTRYELTAPETLGDLVDYAGGFVPRAAEENVRVARYEGGLSRVLNVDARREAPFALRDGDEVEVPIIDEPIEDYVSVLGAVLLPGRYGYRENMTVGGVLDRARPKPSAKLDLAFIERDNPDGTSRLERVDLSEGGAGRATPLRRGDVVRVLAQARFTDEATFKIRGAVRDGARVFAFPADGGVTLEEAILLGGGLTDQAIREALVIRKDPANPRNLDYLRIPLDESGGYELRADDEVVIYQGSRFADTSTVSILGAVREPGEFAYSPQLTLPDLLYLAGGLRLSAKPDRVEVFRVNLDRENGAETSVLQLSIDSVGTPAGQFALQPYDRVVVRDVADYSLVETVSVEGEVRYPGLYALQADRNRVSDFVARAGGLRAGAFAAGATLRRADDPDGYVVLDLVDILARPTGPENIELLPGDIIQVPSPQEIVTIELPGTVAAVFRSDSATASGAIRTVYQGPHDAGWYVERFAGGFNGEQARKRWTTVQYANGQIRETSSVLGVRNYPTVRPGAVIRVGLKPPKKPRERERTSFGDLATATLALVTTLVTLVVLIRQTN